MLRSASINMNLALRIAAAVLSVPPDVLAPMVPMVAPPPRNALEFELRNEVETALSGSCCSNDAAPLFAVSREEADFVDCNSGLPGDESLYASEGGEESHKPSTYGEITSLGARQLFHHLGLTRQNANNYQFFDLGSGGGRLVVQAHLELPSVVRSVGIELSPSRHQVALQTWDNIVRSGDAERIRKMAEKSWGVQSETTSSVELHEGDLFGLDISQATHLYLSSLCFSEDMLERIVDKIEREGNALQVVASLRSLKVQKDDSRKRRVRLGSNPWMEFVEMSWTKARGDGCPVYFYSIE